MACIHHPMAILFAGHCPVCLLEGALGSAEPVGCISMESLRIDVPLGRSASASVYLARSGEQHPRLVRLKKWHTPAPPGFLEAFRDLRARLTTWAQPLIVLPLAACVDAEGCPSVVSEFRQGMPVLDRVRRGRLDRDAAVAAVTVLLELTLAAHARGLVHGSVVAGNLLAEPGAASVALLDFGMAPLLAPPGGDRPLAAADVLGFASLIKTLRELPPMPAPTAPL
jgi:hypothetical protein